MKYTRWERLLLLRVFFFVFVVVVVAFSSITLDSEQPLGMLEKRSAQASAHPLSPEFVCLVL